MLNCRVGHLGSGLRSDDSEVVLRCGAALSTVLTGPIRLVIVGEGGQIDWLHWNTEVKWTS